MTTVKLEDCISTLKGNAFKSSDYTDDGIPVVRVSDFTDNSISSSDIVYIPLKVAEVNKKYELKTNDILIQTVGSWQHNPASIVGKVVKVPKVLNNSLLNQNAVKIIPRSNVDQAFLYYRLKDETFKLHVLGCAQGAANQASITLTTIGAFKFELPELHTQKKIGLILSAYDDLIENNLKRIKLLEEMAQITYEEWFVRMKFPGHETAVFDEEAGLPEGWANKKLGDIITLNYGKALKAEHRNEGKYPVYGSAGVVGFHDTPLVEDEGIILGRKGNVGAVHWSFEHFYPIDTVYYVTSELSLHYVYYLLKHQEFINNDAAVPGLNRNAAYAKKITLPAAEVVNQFGSKVLDIFSLIHNIQRQNEFLKEARDILLPRLMTGMIDIEQVELPEAMLKRLEQQEDKMATAV